MTAIDIIGFYLLTASGFSTAVAAWLWVCRKPG